MNGKSPYEIISDYCQTEKQERIIERILYHKYSEELLELIESYKNNNNQKEPPKDTAEAFTTTLLSKNNLSKNVRLAEEELNEVLSEKIRQIEKKIGRGNFWKSVWASIVASFLFVLLSIIIFKVAENQVKSIFGFGPSTASQSVQNK